jgi:hypothetical protein
MLRELQPRAEPNAVARRKETVAQLLAVPQLAVAQRNEKRSLPVMQLLVVWQDSWEDFD